MITRDEEDRTRFEIECGICGDVQYLDTFDGEFSEALEEKRRLGWGSGRDDADDWIDICMACREKRAKGR